MIEDNLINYGVLGAWTAWLIYEKQKLLTKLNRTLEKNTEALKEVCKFMTKK